MSGPETIFKPGDIVTRDGTDLQRVIESHGYGDLTHVECVQDALGWLQDDGVSRSEPWCRVGDREWLQTDSLDFPEAVE